VAIARIGPPIIPARMAEEAKLFDLDFWEIEAAWSNPIICNPNDKPQITIPDSRISDVVTSEFVSTIEKEARSDIIVSSLC
jgi:hypothetical protein